VALLLGTAVQFCNTPDCTAPCHCIAYDRVRAGHFSNSIWSKDVGGTFCSSACKFLVEHALWRATGWTDWLWTEMCHCGVGWVSVDTVMDHAELIWRVRVLTLKMTAPQLPKTSYTVHPMTQYHML